MIYIIGNWKSNQTQTQSQIWLSSFAKLNPQIDPSTNTILCLPFTDIPEANRFLSKIPLPLHLGAQDVSPFPSGSHTGQISASMLAELVSFCIVGHSEVRREENETSENVKDKVINLLKYKITPIICLDTPYVDEQVKLLLKENVNLSNCIFAYEPVSAIGSGKAQKATDAQKICTQISFLTGGESSILYGGSVDTDNVAEYVGQTNIDGVLVGGQSLDPLNFYKLIKQAKP